MCERYVHLWWQIVLDSIELHPSLIAALKLGSNDPFPSALSEEKAVTSGNLDSQDSDGNPSPFPAVVLLTLTVLPTEKERKSPKGFRKTRQLLVPFGLGILLGKTVL